MPRTPGLVPLGDTGNIHIPWKQLVSAKKKAEKFREKADPGTDDDLRRLAGSTYSDKIYQHFLTWGASLPDRDLYKRCLARGLIGADPHIMEDLMVAIKDSAALDEPVMITGETGTGKEPVARSIHEESDRHKEKFIAVNCAGIPDTLLESELFGHVRGAFTGAGKARVGIFAQADEGTVFLDEIGDMPRLTQAKVLRVLNDGLISPVGAEPGDRKTVNVRVISATHRDVKDPEILRNDLYYRVSTMEVHLWPLFLRPGDLLLLAYYFISEWNVKHQGDEIHAITPGALEDMATYRWPGNVREMRNQVQRACAIASNRLDNRDVIPGFDIPREQFWITRSDFSDPVIALDDLPTFDLYGLMEKRNQDRPLDRRGGWTLEGRLRMLLAERKPGAATPAVTETSEQTTGDRGEGGEVLARLLGNTDYQGAVADFRRLHITYHFQLNDRNLTQTGRALGISRETVKANLQIDA